MVNYWDRLEPEMTKRKMEITDLAKALGVSFQAVAKVRDGGSFGSKNNLKAAQLFGLDPHWLATGKTGQPSIVLVTAKDDESNVEPEKHNIRARRTPVVGTARMGDEGYYEELGYPAGHGDGYVDGYSSDPNAYALRVRGDSMHPAIRHGSFVVIEPNGQCVPGEYIILALRDGRKMVKELVIERPGEIVIESVNGNHRQTIDRQAIEKMQPVAAVVSASKWRSS